MLFRKASALAARTLWRVLLPLALVCSIARAQNVITTVAGTDFLFTGSGRPANQAPVGGAGAVVADGRGNLYIASITYSMVLKVGPDGALSIVAGNGIRAFSGDGGPGVNASLFSPGGVALDSAGNLYIADAGNHRIRKVTTDGIISTVAGAGRRGFAGDGGAATAALLAEPEGVAVDAPGNLYIADTANHRARKVTSAGVISTIAGTGQPGLFGDGGPATNASLNKPNDVAVDAAGVLYIADTTNHAIRKVANGILSTVAGTGIFGFSGDGGPATDARLLFPSGITVDGTGNLYITDNENNRVRKVTTNGIINTVAGTGASGFGSGGFAGDGGPATKALLSSPQKTAVDAAGNLFIADLLNRRVRKVDTAGVISTFAGNGVSLFSGDSGPATSAALNGLFGITLDARGNLYVADTLNQRIRRVTPEGVISTVAGSGETGFSGDGGPATAATMNLPVAVAVDAAGNLYFADFSNGRVRKVPPGGTISTVAGNGTLDFGGDGGLATNAALFGPFGLALDASGNLYISETAIGRVRKVTPNGIINMVAGMVSTSAGGFSGDGGPATSALLNGPAGLAIDAAGNLYIADQANHRIRRVTPNGIINTIAGNGTAGFSGDGGLATNASLSSPKGIALDAAGNLYIADRGNLRIRRVTPAGIITTVAGGGQALPLGDGGPAVGAYLDNPQDATLDSGGVLYIADSGNNRVRAVLTTPPTFTISVSETSALAFSSSDKPQTQDVTLLSSVPGLPFAVTTTTSTGEGWLSANPIVGSMPAVVQIQVDSRLATRPGSGTVTFTAPSANPPSRRVTVALNLLVGSPGGAPKLDVVPDSLSFPLTQGSDPATATLTVTNTGDAPGSFTATAETTSGDSWLSVSPAAGTLAVNSTVALNVRAVPGDLIPGTYAGRIVITVSETAQRVAVPVTLTITRIEQTILVSQKGLTFTAVAGGAVVLPPGSFVVANAGKGVMSWSASVQTFSGGSGWLSVAPAAGRSEAGSPRPPAVQVSANPPGLAAGTYYGRVRIAVPGATNSPQDVAVMFEILAAGSNPGPVVQPAELIFTGVAGGASPGSQDLFVYNLVRAPLNYRSTSEPWLTRLPPDGAVAADQPARIVVQPDPSALASGLQQGNVTLQFSDGSVRNVKVLFVLARGSGASLSVDGTPQAGCTPGSLLPVFSILNPGFTVRAGWPVPLDMLLVDNCGNRISIGAVIATFTNGDPLLPLLPLGEGRWSGTWQAKKASADSVTVGIDAAVPGTNLKGSIRINGAVRANPNNPIVNPGGVVSAASFAPRTPLAPGSLVSIFGSKLADDLGVSTRLPLETQLAGAQAVIAGSPAPLLFASDGQINAMIPFDVNVNAQQQIVITRGSTYAIPEFLTIAAAQPAIFSKNQRGSGQGVIVDLGGRYLEPGNAAKIGDAIVIYCSGLGAVDPPVPSGAAAPSSPLSQIMNEIRLTIGGLTAKVLFAGLTPGFAGLYQVNAVVPEGVAGGDAVPVVISVAGQSSRPVTMAVR